MRHNKLCEIPPVIYSLVSLTHLFLRFNRIRVVDEAIGRLTVSSRHSTLPTSIPSSRLISAAYTPLVLLPNTHRLRSPHKQRKSLPLSLLISQLSFLSIYSLPFKQLFLINSTFSQNTYYFQFHFTCPPLLKQYFTISPLTNLSFSVTALLTPFQHDIRFCSNRPSYLSSIPW